MNYSNSWMPWQLNYERDVHCDFQQKNFRVPQKQNHLA